MRQRLFERATALFRQIFELPKKALGGVRRVGVRYPVATFLILLMILLGLIIGGSILRAPEPTTEEEMLARKVPTFTIGETPRYTTTARIEKSGVVTIVAQAGGIVNRIAVTEGEAVWRGTNLISLSNTYTGANAASVQRQIAQQQYDLAKETYDSQLSVIDKQRQLAHQTDANADELRELSIKSADETRGALALNEEILAEIESNLADLEALPPDPATDELILATKQLQAQYVGIINQLKSTARSLDYQSGNENPPAEISDISKDMALLQLDIQQKSLAVGLEVAKLQLQLARIQEALFYPSSPFEGVVEQVYVREGQSVAPGTPLMTISGESQTIKAVVEVPATVARSASLYEATQFSFGDETFSITPYYISTEATAGQRYTIFYAVPREWEPQLTDGQRVTVEVPVGYAQTSTAVPYIPLDAVFQTQDSATVFFLVDGKAESRELELGAIFGEFVEVRSGLAGGDIIILDRTVVAGDAVEPVIGE